jgi:hypothetical protein
MRILPTYTLESQIQNLCSVILVFMWIINSSGKCGLLIHLENLKLENQGKYASYSKAHCLC